MSGHSDADPAVSDGIAAERKSAMSRRSVLRGAAGAGAAGLAAAAGAGALAAAARPAAAAPAARPAKHAEPVVVYLRDASTGELEAFTGTSQVRFRDPALAARLLRAVQ
jgi:hypothetical protein